MTSRSPTAGMPAWLLVIACMNAVGPVSIDLYLPAFTMIETEFGEHGVARTMASYLFGLTIGQLFYGPISDHFGRKPPLYFGYAVYTIGALGCALSTSMTMLMIFRVVQAIGGSSGMSIGRAIVRDRCQPEEAARAFSMLMSIVSIAPIVAPIGGGFIVPHFGWRACFYFQAALGIGILLGMHFLLRESLAVKPTGKLNLFGVLRTYFSLLRNRHLVSYALMGGFGFAAMFAYVSGAPTVLPAIYDISPQLLGWLIGMNGIAFMLASRINLRALRKGSPAEILARCVRRPPVVGAVLICVAIAQVYGYVVPLVIWLALQFAFFVTTARISPNVSALAMAPFSREAGSASAVMGAAQSIIPTLSGLAISFFAHDTLLPLACIMTTSVAIAWALHIGARANA